jgi:hypothetical protein
MHGLPWQEEPHGKSHSSVYGKPLSSVPRFATTGINNWPSALKFRLLTAAIRGTIIFLVAIRGTIIFFVPIRGKIIFFVAICGTHLRAVCENRVKSVV